MLHVWPGRESTARYTARTSGEGVLLLSAGTYKLDNGANSIYLPLCRRDLRAAV